jgi:hypothetical protein
MLNLHDDSISGNGYKALLIMALLGIPPIIILVTMSPKHKPAQQRFLNLTRTDASLY